jgi:GNAT superfamily N-acetyltransferase
MTLDDVAAGHALSRAAGWNQRADDWRLLLANNPGRFVAALSDERVVGTAGAACYGKDLAWVCMVLVDAAARGRGVGTRLMEEVLERLDDMAVVGLDATPLGQPVYRKLGFGEAATFQRVGVDLGGGGRAGSPARPAAAGDLDEILAVDRRVFGADRATVLRWAHERAPAFCLPSGGRMVGYCFGRRGEHSRQIGPIVADTAEEARTLLDAALAGVTGRVVLDAFADRAWLEALASVGFTGQRPLIRMYRHGAAPPGLPARQLAIFGPEFG